MRYRATPPALSEETEETDDSGGGTESDRPDDTKSRMMPANSFGALEPTKMGNRPILAERGEPDGGVGEPPRRLGIDWL